MPHLLNPHRFGGGLAAFTSLLSSHGAIWAGLMQDPSGSTLTALIGSNGSYVGTPTLGASGPSAVLPSAAQFNGSSQRATAPVNFSSYNQVTFTFWLWWDTFADNDAMCLAAPVPYYGTGVRGLIVNPNATGVSSRFQAAMSEPTSVFRDRVCTRHSTGAWHHWGIRFNRAGSTVSWLLDGATPSGDVANLSGSMTSTFTGTSLSIMSYGAGYYGAGRMAGLAVFPSLLSDAQIQAQRSASM